MSKRVLFAPKNAFCLFVSDADFSYVVYIVQRRNINTYSILLQLVWGWAKYRLNWLDYIHNYSPSATFIPHRERKKINRYSMTATFSAPLPLPRPLCPCGRVCRPRGLGVGPHYSAAGASAPPVSGGNFPACYTGHIPAPFAWFQSTLHIPWCVI